MLGNNNKKKNDDDDLRDKLLPGDSTPRDSSFEMRESGHVRNGKSETAEETKAINDGDHNTKIVDYEQYEKEHNFMCPITCDIMAEPVQLLLADPNNKNGLFFGEIFEKSAIDKWIIIDRKRNNHELPLCPITREGIRGYVDAKEKHKEIQAYLQQHPDREAIIQKVREEDQKNAIADSAAMVARAVAMTRNENSDANLVCRSAIFFVAAVATVTIVSCVLWAEPPCGEILIRNNATDFNFVDVDGVDCEISSYSMPYGNSSSVSTGADGFFETCHLDTDNAMIGAITTYGSGVRTDGDEIDGCHIETTREAGVKCTWYLEKVCNTDDADMTITQGFLSALVSVAFDPPSEHKPNLRGAAEYWMKITSWEANNVSHAYTDNAETEQQQQTMALST